MNNVIQDLSIVSVPKYENENIAKNLFIEKANVNSNWISNLTKVYIPEPFFKFRT